MTPTRHPSHLQLDRYALGAASDAGLRAHVEGCADCRAHLEQVKPVEAVPAWVTQLAARPPLRPRWRAQLPSLLCAAALASAAAVMVMRAPSEPSEPSEPTYDTSKGMPSVWVHVQHDGVRGVWDGMPLTAGDHIRLELAPEQFRHVTVFSTNPPATPTLLYRAALRPHVRSALDKAWQLDGRVPVEHLTVVFSRAELSESAARQTLQEHDPDQVYQVELTLPMRAAP